MFGKHHSVETKIKIGLKSIGRKIKHTNEFKKRMSEMNIGKTLSEETKRKMSEAHKGKKHTEEEKLKIGNSNKGKNFSRSFSEGSGRCQWFLVNDIKCRGTYERRFVEACFKWGVFVERNYKRFYFENFTYSPDFYCKDLSLIEIKGIFNEGNLRNLNECKSKGIRIFLVFKEQLKEFEKTGNLRAINILEQNLEIYLIRKRKN